MSLFMRTKQSRGSTGDTGRGISFSALAGVASLVAGVVLLPIIISAVGPSAYGTWLFLVAAANFLFFLDLGVGTAVVHFIARSRSGDEESDPSAIASTAHAWALGAAIIAIVVFLLIGWSHSAVALEVVSQQELGILISCGSLLIVSMALRPMSSVLFGAGYLHVERKNQILGVVIRIVGTVIACSFSHSVVGVAIAETVALIAPTVLSAITVKRLGLVQVSSKSVSKKHLKRMFSYSMGAFTVSMVGAAVLQFGTLIIGVLGSPSQVTYFNAAFRIYASVRQVIGWLTDPFRSVLSRLYVNDHSRAKSVLYDLLFVSFITSVLGCVLLLLTLPGVLKIWLGDSAPLGEVGLTSSVLLAGLVLNAMHIPLVPASDAAGRPGAFLPHQIAWLIAYAGLSYLLFPLMGIAGVALAMTLPLPAIEFAYLMRSQATVSLNFEIWFLRVIKPAIPVLLLGLISALTINVIGPDWVGVLYFGFIYIALSLLTLYGTRKNWRYKSIRESLRLEA